MSRLFDVVVIGGGQSGLASGYHLKKSGLTFLILEASAEAAGSWPRYYDSLKLFSPAKYSSLPGMSFPTPGDRYPTRDEVIHYLKDYALHYELPITYHSRVKQVIKVDRNFQIMTETGETYRARNIICATGSFSRPYMPQIDGQSEFKGTLLHSAHKEHVYGFISGRDC